MGGFTSPRPARSHRRLVAAGAAVLTITSVGAIAAAQSATAVSPDVVISEVYGGGGNSGATLTNDFIELHNRSASPVDVSGWSVQYASATGTTWLRTNLSGTIPAGAHYLVQEAAGAGGTEPLPAPDAVGSTAMSATSGKVALVTNQTALTCATSCSTVAGVRDFVGYGSANDFEGAGPAPGLSNTTSASRDENGTDTDNNSADFTAGPPVPQSTTGGGPQPATPARIHDIQASLHRSPLEGDLVVTPGVVTAAANNGFWFQDPEPDADPATSEGLFVFTSSRPTVSVGDAIHVTGTVSEFRPGGTSSANLTTTELTAPRIVVDASGVALPAPTVLGPGGRVAPTEIVEDDANGDVETGGVFDPAFDGIDFYESLEGMRLEVDDAVAVGPRNPFGEIPVLPANGDGAGVRTDRGGIVLQRDDANPERVILDDVLAPTPTANVGDRFPGPVVGVLDYSFGNFKLYVTSTPIIQPGGLQREVTAAPRGGQLTVGTFNVENLSAVSPQQKFDDLAQVVVNNLRSPDILAIEEIQDNDGTTDSGTVDASQTWAKLIASISAAGGPTYDWRSIDPVDNEDGGAPGGNIRVGFLFRTDIDLTFIDRPGGDATTPVDVVEIDNSGKAKLTLSPGRIDPQNAAFDDSRKPLVGEFKFRGKTVFVVANHWNSKGGDSPLFGQFQPQVLASETQRLAQATVVAGFVSKLLAIQPDARLVVAGDLNDFPWSPPVEKLTDMTKVLDLPANLPPSERYTYVFDGNSQVLDHILLSPALAELSYEYDVVHVNSEFADQVSDHEPQVVRLPIKKA
jgi:predicted extracellular nuclease